MTTSVIIPAAGSGKRFGSTLPKQYKELRALPLLVRTLSIFTQMQEVGTIMVAVSADMMDVARELIEDYHPRRITLCEGGAERHQSIENCLQHPALSHSNIVLVHDAVRPFASQRLIRALIAEAQTHGACIPGLPVTDTTKEIDSDGFVLRTHPREFLRSIQTPQAFERQLLIDAYAHARAQQLQTTDDAGVVEAFGHKVKVIDGEAHNVKITTQQDWDYAERYIDAGITEAINLRHM